MMPDHLLLINVKNYSFNNQGDQARSISEGIIHQMQYSQTVLRAALEKERIRLPIKLALVFVNPAISHFYLMDTEDKIDHVVQADAIELELIKLAYHANSFPKFNYGRLYNGIAKYRVADKISDVFRFVSVDYLRENCSQRMPCPTCHQPLKRLSREAFHCEKNHRFTQKELVLTAVEDFQLITQSETFRMADIQNMIPAISEKVYWKHLSDHYPKIEGKTKGSIYSVKPLK